MKFKITARPTYEIDVNTCDLEKALTAAQFLRKYHLSEDFVSKIREWIFCAREGYPIQLSEAQLDTLIRVCKFPSWAGAPDHLHGLAIPLGELAIKLRKAFDYGDLWCQGLSAEHYVRNE